MSERGRWYAAGKVGGWPAFLLLALLLLLLTACRSSTPALPTPAGGVYTSTQFHFSVTYPAGWQVNVPPSQDASATIPLTLLITYTNAQANTGTQVSTFTVTVFNAHDPTAAAGIAALLKQAKAPNSPLQPVTIAGKQGYQDQPTVRAVAGTSFTDTHTDYYLITSSYEYQISTDAISADNVASALQSMLTSFTLLK